MSNDSKQKISVKLSKISKIVILISVILFILILLIPKKESQSSVGSDVVTTSQSQIQSKPLDSDKTKENQKEKTVSSNIDTAANFDCNIEKVEYLDYENEQPIGIFGSLDYNCKYISFLITLKNIGKINITPNRFELKDINGKTYEEKCLLPNKNFRGSLLTSVYELKPDETIKGWVTYEIPMTLDHKECKIRLKTDEHYYGVKARSDWFYFKSETRW